MKKSVFVSGIASALLVSSLAWAQAKPKALGESVPVNLENVFIPAQGFDDNDNVQAVVEGYLPNICYTVGNTQFQVDAQTKTIQLTQTAYRNSEGPCASERTLPPDLAAAIPFNKEVNFGQLPAGNYKIRFVRNDSGAEKLFAVDIAPVQQVDSLRYALVTNAFVHDENKLDHPHMEIRVAGYLTSSCAVVSDASKVEKVGDVYIVLLSIETLADMCLPQNKPFYKVFEVATPNKAGRYLLHVRSLGGQAKNKLFSVVP